jgi:Zn/Cd-binding protein ZinT
MASIQKRGKTYQFTVSHMVSGGLKLIRRGGFKTKKEAQIAAVEIKANFANVILPHLKQMTLDEYFEKWMTLYKSNLTKTIKLYYDYTFRGI